VSSRLPAILCLIALGAARGAGAQQIPDPSPAADTQVSAVPAADQIDPAVSANYAALTALPNPGDDLDSCASSDCSLDLPSADALTGQHYKTSIPLGALGFFSRVNSEILAPEQDEALAWLGPDELLIAFNPHLLVPRHGNVAPGSIVRVIRAVLVDVSTRTVERMVEWRICDREQYLWHLPGNRILVHVGAEMRVYGAGLRLQDRVGLAGPLAFARVSPDGNVIALGVFRERHPPTLHARLVALQEDWPDPDLQVLLVNDRFRTIAASLPGSGPLPPVLLNEGQVRIEPPLVPDSFATRRFALQLRTWDDLSRTLGEFKSSCAPGLSSLTPDLLFLVTCAGPSQTREFRVLRADGKVVLHGRSALNDLGHAAGGGGRQTLFAIRIFNADEPIVTDQPFHPADLKSAQLGVFRCEDGKRLFSLRLRNPAASSEGYALSPDGDVAIFGQEGVDLFSMPR